MSDAQCDVKWVLCPECKGRGMIRPPGEWHNETCPTCDGRGQVAAEGQSQAENSASKH